MQVKQPSFFESLSFSRVTSFTFIFFSLLFCLPGNISIIISRATNFKYVGEMPVPQNWKIGL